PWRPARSAPGKVRRPDCLPARWPPRVRPSPGWWSSLPAPSAVTWSGRWPQARTAAGSGDPEAGLAAPAMTGNWPPGSVLGHLRELLDDCRAGTGMAVLVNGRVASGKSEQLQALCADAAACGVHVLTATCARSERELPLAALGQLAHSGGLPAESRRALLNLLAEVPL